MKISKKTLFSAALILIMGIFSCQDSTSPVTNYTVTVSGVVNRLVSGSPLDSVVVTLNNPFRRDTTKKDGTFNYSFVSSEKNDVNTTLRLSRFGFYDSVIAVTYG
ncbi:MAG: hypothetical protein PHP42_10340, partial [Bacteroidota bacterium]|nr:hypothetical protein [Bacteroidota bacterium]